MPILTIFGWDLPLTANGSQRYNVGHPQRLEDGDTVWNIGAFQLRDLGNGKAILTLRRTVITLQKLRIALEIDALDVDRTGDTFRPSSLVLGSTVSIRMDGRNTGGNALPASRDRRSG